ncbi:hypothetical protein ISF_01509 [Cordyceps fumosorosea ARSEF 2679]|uniref:Uncharacterized protein n=1 Tax=Cordyceps fumosorosea (strain ARSEF 2679) TaxID=1081104 RepID=A0A168DCH2_CORFA|nr:hypothetical protein ISF_01509 [Cordyceps fumosorosea ARSEF 2679]OAA72436.1 hypothetical protein ISF_01509 [Cordyceps fumosorosea ARSEF 2679]
MGSDSVGSLLADIANLIVDGLRILGLADKRHWGPDEYELQRAMERVLNDAKADFQELSPLLKSQSHYEHDRTFASLEELRALRGKFYMHMQNMREWSRSGGPVDAVWVRDTKALQRQLHRAQCRAAQRVFGSAKETSRRCLGAFIVHRRQRAWLDARRAGAPATDHDCRRRQLDELAECRAVGGFERFGDADIAFVCDFCDGHLLWDDVERVPTTRTGLGDDDDTLPDAAGGGALLPTAATPLQDALGAALSEWRATAVSVSGGRERKQVVYPPMAVASHMAPLRGDWQARFLCPLCEDAAEPQDIDDEDEMWRPDNRFDDLAALQEHLEWEHAPPARPSTLPLSLPSADKCVVM